MVDLTMMRNVKDLKKDFEIATLGSRRRGKTLLWGLRLKPRPERIDLPYDKVEVWIDGQGGGEALGGNDG